MTNTKTLVFCSLLFILLFANQTLKSQEKQYRIACIGFYNLENLFDTINDPNVDDEEFLPNAKNEWTSARYWIKINHLSEVISQIGDEYIKGGPVIMGVSEIENKEVMEDLITSPPLNKTKYAIVHYDSPDKRGVDVGLIYQTARFKVINSRSVRLHYPLKPEWRTRDQLVVTGKLDDEVISIIVNHWPSRSSGEKESAPLRQAAADLTRSLADSLLKLDINAKIIIMGDLNDNPTDVSLVKNLKIKDSPEKTQQGDLFDPMYKMYTKEGLGSLAYRDAWSLFDQIIISKALLGEDKSSFKFYKAKIFNRPFITTKEGAYKGYPMRTYAGGVFLGGYSDHFPVYVFLVKDKK